ncbi:MAG: hypothetical protein KF773_20340 [Deltaproteobacteria bacterium]|nr:hypothetical protein [Deltaproteobacteria bacterium]
MMLKFSGLGVALLLSLLSTPAAAAPVDNPGYFFWNGITGYLTFNQSSPFTLMLPSGGSLDTDIDGSGNVTINSMSTAPYTSGGITVQLIVNAGSSSMTLNAATGAVSGTLSLRVRITGGGVGSSCVTSSFSASTTSSFYSYNSGTQVGEIFLYTGWLTVPALTSCNGAEGTLNAGFGFGVPNEGLQIDRLLYRASGGPVGS